MDLRTFLKTSNQSQVAFARKIETSPEAVRRYVEGIRIPSRRAMQAIIAVTGGEVQPNDFFARSAGGGAEPERRSA